MSFLGGLGQNNTQLQQIYSAVLASPNLYGTFTIDVVELGAFTASTPCEPGLILALMTGGAQEGLYINYVDSGTDGQGTANCILLDQYLTNSPTQTGNYAYVLRIGKVIGSALSVTSGSTLSTALGQLQAVSYYDGSGQLCYDVRGPAVS